MKTLNWLIMSMFLLAGCASLTPSFWYCRKVGIVAGQERFQSRLRGLVGCCGGQLEDRAGIGLGVISPGVEQVHLTVLLPTGTSGIKARLLPVEPRFHPRIRGLDDGAVVKDSLLHAIEMALDGVLRLLRRRHRVALESLQPAVDPMELDPEFAAKAVNMLAHVSCSSSAACSVRRPLGAREPLRPYGRYGDGGTKSCAVTNSRGSTVTAGAHDVLLGTTREIHRIPD